MVTMGELIWAQAARNAAVAKWWFRLKVLLAFVALAVMVKYLLT